MSQEFRNCRRGVVCAPQFPFLLVQIFHIYSINTLPLTLASNSDLSGLYCAPVTIWWITFLSGIWQHRSHSPTRFRCLCGTTPRPSVADLVMRMDQTEAPVLLFTSTAAPSSQTKTGAATRVSAQQRRGGGWPGSGRPPPAALRGRRAGPGQDPPPRRRMVDRKS